MLRLMVGAYWNRVYRLQIVEVDTVDPIDFKASFTGILLKNSEARKISGEFLDFTAAANPKSMISKKKSAYYYRISEADLPRLLDLVTNMGFDGSEAVDDCLLVIVAVNIVLDQRERSTRFWFKEVQAIRNDQ